MLQPGDKVRIEWPLMPEEFGLVDSVTQLFYAGFNKQSVFEVVKEEEFGVVLLKHGLHSFYVSKQFLSPIDAANPAVATCTCPLNTLMTSGCQCGGV